MKPCRLLCQVNLPDSHPYEVAGTGVRPQIVRCRADPSGRWAESAKRDQMGVCSGVILRWGSQPGSSLAHGTFQLWVVCVWLIHIPMLQDAKQCGKVSMYLLCLWLGVRLTQIAKFMGPTWGPPGSCRPQMGPMLAPWTLQSGKVTSLLKYNSHCSVTQSHWFVAGLTVMFI